MTTNPNPLRIRRRVSLKFGESLTEQSHKKSCQISTILDRYKKTGIITHNNSMQGTYADYPNEMDFHLMQNKIAVAKSMFEAIPSNIRAEFNNDPGTFLSFAQDPENREKMLEMGFSIDHLPPAVEPEPEPAPEPEPEPEPEPGPVPT